MGNFREQGAPCKGRSACIQPTRQTDQERFIHHNITLLHTIPYLWIYMDMVDMVGWLRVRTFPVPSHCMQRGPARTVTTNIRIQPNLYIN
ncbi:hypothetical protein BDFG_09473 [Blastomyces dermatitidis ATCC 26199]|nr:hypothetical protein BDFG_09473 [Blastomyces dermatitidis ATCC 26199]